MSNDDANPSRPRRERSTRYPGVPLAEAIKLCESIQELGVDGLPAPDVAAALGYKNIKTNTFSARLSAARQFGLLHLNGDGYGLTPLAREILHPVDPDELPRLYRQALVKPPLYSDLAERLGGKKLPDPAILGNVLYHSHQIIATAKQAAADAFLESARFAGALGDDNVFLPGGSLKAPAPSPTNEPDTAPRAPASTPARFPVDPPRPAPEPVDSRPPRSAEARLDLKLWDADAGKTIRLRAPESISAASYERFLQALKLLVRIAPDDPEFDAPDEL